jgi:hypothetical protein
MHGIAWPKNSKINFETWYLYVEHELGVIPAHTERQTEPVYHSFGAYQSWEEFRDFANKTRKVKEPVFEDLSLNTVKTNEQEITIELNDKKVSYIQGTVELKSSDKVVLGEDYSVKDKVRAVKTTASLNHMPLQKVEAKYEINGLESLREALLINPQDGMVSIHFHQNGEHEVLEASNGSITIAASASFFPALHSLKAFGKEWLDTSFPKLQPKSWWNPWSGGIRSSLAGITHKSSAKERTTVGEAILFDQHGKEWKGIKISTTFTENEVIKGFGIEQFFVMLPGVPVVAYCIKIIQNTGTYFHYKKWYTESAFKPAKTIDQSWIKSNDGDVTYVAGKSEFATELNDHILLGSKTDDHILQIIADRDSIEIETYINKEILSLVIWREMHLANGEELLSSPTFFVAHDSILGKDEVKQLQRINFKEGSNENH